MEKLDIVGKRIFFTDKKWDVSCMETVKKRIGKNIFLLDNTYTINDPARFVKTFINIRNMVLFFSRK